MVRREEQGTHLKRACGDGKTTNSPTGGLWLVGKIRSSPPDALGDEGRLRTHLLSRLVDGGRIDDSSPDGLWVEETKNSPPSLWMTEELTTPL